MKSETQKSAWAEFIKKHPFQFNLLRLLSDGSIIHINSLYKNYNCKEADLMESNSVFRKKIICKTESEIKNIVDSHDFAGRQNLYILTTLTMGMIKNVA